MARDARKTENLPAGDNTTPMSPVISYAMQIGGERTKTHTHAAGVSSNLQKAMITNFR
jgi:hypothetical protein